MRCHHFDSGACGSCTLLDLPRPRQLARGREHVEQLLAPHLAPGTIWSEPIVGAERGFRARGKMAVGGTAQAPLLTLPGQSAGTDLCDCPLYPDGVEEVLEGAKALIRRAQIPPYDVARRRGEIKNVLVTTTPDGEHQLRFVLRSDKALPRLVEHLPRLLKAHPSVIAVSANLHPEHTTAVEGATEIPLHGPAAIPVRTGDVTLFAPPGSFLQTHTEVAGQLYRQAAAWIAALPAARHAGMRIWDLYCGLGGFALHAARALPSALITGVEVSAAAIAGAREGADALGAEHTTFLAGDATQWAKETTQGADGPPDAVIVNPPRRGLGEELATWLEGSGVTDVVYSSCNPTTLAKDLERIPSYRIAQARFVDMFPHTRHAEVLTRLVRT